MITIETKINGKLIGYASVVNSLVKCDEGTQEENCIYQVKYHRIGRRDCVLEFLVVHRIADGAENLVSLVYSEVNKRLKKK